MSTTPQHGTSPAGHKRRLQISSVSESKVGSGVSKGAGSRGNRSAKIHSYSASIGTRYNRENWRSDRNLRNDYPVAMPFTNVVQVQYLFVDVLGVFDLVRVNIFGKQQKGRTSGK
jgi:hypothetical protein